MTQIFMDILLLVRCWVLCLLVMFQVSIGVLQILNGMFSLPLDFHFFPVQMESVKNQGVINRLTLLELDVGSHLVLLHRQSLDVPCFLENVRQRVFINLPVQIANVDAVEFIFRLAGLGRNRMKKV